MNERQAKRAIRFSNKVVKVFHAEPVVFGVQPTGLRGITVDAYGPDEKDPFASLYINSIGEGSLRATGMAAALRAKIRG